MPTREQLTRSLRIPRLPRLGNLGEAEEFQQTVFTADTDVDDLFAHYRAMLMIRQAEERIGLGVEERSVRCPAHLAIGQEAIPVGVSAHLRPTDRVFGAHRSHGHYLAMGGSLHSLFAEVLGRVTGASRGMGGSMHLWNGGAGFGGSVPIVAATVPIAVGAALAAKMSGGGDVAVVYVGDGAFEEGVVHESMNLAAVMRLPVLFVAENNLFASHLHIDLRQPSDKLGRFADANGIPNALCDGNDVVQVSGHAANLLEACRSDNMPGFLEAVTYRWRGHVGPKEDQDVGVDRQGDLVNWKLRDPVGRLARALRATGTPPRMLEIIAEEVAAEVAAAWAQALRDPLPPAGQMMDCVYAPVERAA
ncbi:thiamine pyrophosphate-dependent dehydrogenase E1 component subunit alpha [Caenimonas sedimenti]|nr:thiamine pyrophosphate-dependent dehydrogenase E1 component subunit alpha [Caenimonas sedimenti]